MNHYADKDSGKYLLATDGPAPENGVLVPIPDNASDIWDGERWVTPVYLSKQAAKTNLNDDFNEAMATLHEGWPDYEVQTWTVQAEEAKSWLSVPEDNKPEIPFLTNLHEQRKSLGWEGSLEDLVNRVMQNTIAYTAATASLIARRHVAEKQIEDAEDPSTVTWDFSL